MEITVRIGRMALIARFGMSAGGYLYCLVVFLVFSVVLWQMGSENDG